MTYDKNYSSSDIQNQSYAFVPFDSTSILDWEPRTAKGEFKGTPTNKSLFDVQFGKSGYHLYRTYQPTCNGKPSSFDNVTQLYDGCRFLQHRRQQLQLLGRRRQLFISARAGISGWPS